MRSQTKKTPSEMTLEEWLDYTPAQALKALAEDMGPAAHGAPKAEVKAYILKHKAARERALESKSFDERKFG